jgi:trypsin
VVYSRGAVGLSRLLWWITLVSARKVKLAAMTSAGIALLSAFPAVALVGGAPRASQNIARHVVMVVGSDNTYCSGVVIAQDLILTAAQCIHPDTRYKIVGLDPPRVLTSVSHVIVHRSGILVRI